MANNLKQTHSGISLIYSRATAMSVLDSKAAFADRLRQLGIEDALKGELQDKGFENVRILGICRIYNTAADHRCRVRGLADQGHL